jgi:hypothetical protein
VTEAELKLLRLEVRIEALNMLVRMLYAGLANISPEATKALRRQFEILRREHSTISLPGVSPEYSDLISSEYQDALDDLLEFIEDGFEQSAS